LAYGTVSPRELCLDRSSPSAETVPKGGTMYRPWAVCPPPPARPAAPDEVAVQPVTQYRILADASSAIDPGPPTLRLAPTAEPSSSPGTASWVGWRLGDLELLAELGRGGMGIVYKAWQRHLDRIVAVKVLRSDQADHPIWRMRFLTEARVAAGL